jgi:hypothetical protein
MISHITGISINQKVVNSGINIVKMRVKGLFPTRRVGDPPSFK